MTHTTLRIARTSLLMAFLLVWPVVHAQVLVVNDNDNITYNTDTLLNDLTAAGITFDVYDIATSGAPPTAALMNGYDLVIWYCSTDGVDLGFWDPGAQADITDRILDGRATWIIGQDLLYAAYGSAPVSFSNGDFALDQMGVASYDLQSYGDDGNMGCPGMEVEPGVSSYFGSGFGWVFSTLWWADGVTPGPDATPIYSMGPAPYVFTGAVSMLHFHAPGTNVMSTFFDPALIGSFTDRVAFLQETIAYMDMVTAVRDALRPVAGLALSQNPATERVVLMAPERIQGTALFDLRGSLVLDQPTSGNDRSTTLVVQGVASGTYLATATGSSGRRYSALLVIE